GEGAVRNADIRTGLDGDPVELAGCDADNYRVAALQPNRAPDCGGVGLEAPAPEGVAQDDRYRAGRTFVVGGQEPRTQAPHSEKLEEVSRDKVSPNPVRRGPVTHRQIYLELSENTGERVAAI